MKENITSKRGVGCSLIVRFTSEKMSSLPKAPFGILQQIKMYHIVFYTLYTERQKKLITSSGSLKSTASKLIIFGHK